MILLESLSVTAAIGLCVFGVGVVVGIGILVWKFAFSPAPQTAAHPRQFEDPVWAYLSGLLEKIGAEASHVFYEGREGVQLAFLLAKLEKETPARYREAVVGRLEDELYSDGLLDRDDPNIKKLSPEYATLSLGPVYRTLDRLEDLQKNSPE